LGSIGSSSLKFDAELVQSSGRPVNVTASAGQNVNLLLKGHLRQTSGSLAVAVDTLSAGGDVNLQLLQGVRESSLPSSPPSYSLNVQENANASPTVVTKHFREDGTGPALVLDLGAFGTTTTSSPTVATTYTFSSAQAAGNINVTGPTTLDVT